MKKEIVNLVSLNNKRRKTKLKLPKRKKLTISLLLREKEEEEEIVKGKSDCYFKPFKPCYQCIAINILVQYLRILDHKITHRIRFMEKPVRSRTFCFLIFSFKLSSFLPLLYSLPVFLDLLLSWSMKPLILWFSSTNYCPIFSNSLNNRLLL